MKKKIELLLETIIPLFIGITLSSLWWRHDETWKTTLPIILMLMSLQRIFDKYNK